MNKIKFSELYSQLFLNRENRIAIFDIYRGFVLLYMVFVNAYFALSKYQKPWLTHDAENMYGGDIIIVFFFFMVGFNLGLVEAIKGISGKSLLMYAVKRGGMLILIGILLIGYSVLLYGNDFSVIFRSFLVILGIGMILSALIIHLFQRFMKYWVYIVFACYVIFALSNELLLWSLPGNYRFLTGAFLLTTLTGYLAAQWYLESKFEFVKRTLYTGVIMIAFTIIYIFIFSNTPTRQTVNAPYIFLSLAVLLISFSFIIKLYINKKRLNSLVSLLAIMGAHPLSFWIIQSLTIAAFVVGATLVKYTNDNMMHYFWQMPAMPRTIENHSLAILTSVAVLLVTSIAHLLFIRIYRSKVHAKK